MAYTKKTNGKNPTRRKKKRTPAKGKGALRAGISGKSTVKAASKKKAEKDRAARLKKKTSARGKKRK